MVRPVRTGYTLAILAGVLPTAQSCRTADSNAVKTADQLDTQPRAVVDSLRPYTGPALPGGAQRAAAGEWADYCVGTPSIADKPTPNYSNPLVKAAVEKLNQISSESLAIHQGSYAPILAKFQTPLPQNAPYKIEINTHDYLNYLCGEFRDRPTLIAAKLKWVASMNYLERKKEGEDYNVKAADAWSQVRIEDYKPYLNFSSALYRAREDIVGTVDIGDQKGVDRPVPGLTVCETKFVFKEFVRAGKTFPGLEPYNQAYERFKSNCNRGDEDYYYDFRGDMNLKPNTPESNAMIWFSQFIANQCESTVKARPDAVITDGDCQKYYTSPFKSRWDAARAGLAAELLHTPEFRDGVRDQDGSQMTIVASSTAQDGYRFGDRGAWSFRLDDPTESKGQNKFVVARTGKVSELLSGWHQHWHTPDFGLAALSGGDTNKGGIKTLLQIAVDRHTNWYAIGFDDGSNPRPKPGKAPADDDKLQLRGGAWSPFVASSYEMSKSDHFASGYTIQAPNDPNQADPTPKKQWMYIFKVKKSHLYNTDRLANEPASVLDFDHFWLDERSFGTDGLAKEERAWDRLGEPLEDEYATILYLHRIPISGVGEFSGVKAPHL